MQISDFFGYYPDIDDDPLFNTKISRKQEFRELAPNPNEPTPSRGGAYRHQTMTVRYITWFDRLLMIHEPGTGKSCIITHSAELFKDEYLKNPSDPTRINRAYILVSNDTLRANIKNEIVCRCTDRIYETTQVLQSAPGKARRNNITRALNKWYSIMRYKEFTDQIDKLSTPDEVDRFMSNIVIYVDESHNVPTKKDISKTQRVDDVNSRYDILHTAFHRGFRNKVVLATATPMINLPVDVIPLMNLILPIDLQMPNMDTDRFVAQPAEFFEPYFRGRVSYVRALDTGATFDVIGEDFRSEQLRNAESIKLYPSPMSYFQYNVYYNIVEQLSFNIDRRQAANFVFPDGSFGITGFNRYVEKLGGGRFRFKNTQEGQQCRQMVGSPEGLPVLSGKYTDTIDICSSRYAADNTNVLDEQGIVFVYFPDFVRGSGAIMLALCMKENGYEEFTATTDIFVTPTGESVDTGPCPSTTETRVPRQSTLPKAKRFALLTGSSTEAQISTILNTLNSYENRYGEYIQVLIGSRTTSEGININNAVAMIAEESAWHYSGNWQAEMRVLRSTSHIMRLEEKRRRTGNPNVTFDVSRYNMAAVYQGDPEATTPEYRDPNFSTVDVARYITSFQKDIQVRHILRYIKQNAYDCFINKARNVRPTDTPGSPQCDYKQCDYNCVGIDPNTVNDIDWTTKILYYSKDEVDGAVVSITDVFSKYSSLKIDQIYRLLEGTRHVYIDMALEKMIRENIAVLNRLGLRGYLRESGDGVIYLESDQFSVESHPENSIYSSSLIGTQNINNNTFNDYVITLSSRDDPPLISELANTQPTDPRFAEIINGLSLMGKVSLLESSLETPNPTMFTDAIIAQFSHNIYRLREPVDLLRRISDRLNNEGKGRGRPRDPNKQPRYSKLAGATDFPMPNFDVNGVGQPVLIHTLLNQSTHTRTEYNAVKRFYKAGGQLRLLKPGSPVGWRNVNVAEHLAYNRLIQLTINQFHEYFESRFSIYGIMLPPSNVFHIRDRESQSVSADGDARKIREGRVCSTWLKPELIDLFYRLGLHFNDGRPQLSDDEMFDQLSATVNRERQNIDLSQFEPDKLRHYYDWYRSGWTIAQMCEQLHLYFSQTGRLFTGTMPSAQYTSSPDVGTVQTSPPVTSPNYVAPTFYTQPE